MRRCSVAAAPALVAGSIPEVPTRSGGAGRGNRLSGETSDPEERTTIPFGAFSAHSRATFLRSKMRAGHGRPPSSTSYRDPLELSRWMPKSDMGMYRGAESHPGLRGRFRRLCSSALVFVDGHGQPKTPNAPPSALRAPARCRGCLRAGRPARRGLKVSPTSRSLLAALPRREVARASLARACLCTELLWHIERRRRRRPHRNRSRTPRLRNVWPGVARLTFEQSWVVWNIACFSLLLILALLPVPWRAPLLCPLVDRPSC